MITKNFQITTGESKLETFDVSKLNLEVSDNEPNLFVVYKREYDDIEKYSVNVVANQIEEDSNSLILSKVFVLFDGDTSIQHGHGRFVYDIFLEDYQESIINNQVQVNPQTISIVSGIIDFKRSTRET